MRHLPICFALPFLAVSFDACQAQVNQPDTKTTQIGGKTMEQWIKEIGVPDPSKRENAIRSVLLFGPERAYEAVPAIIKELDRPPPTDAGPRASRPAGSPDRR